MTRSRTPAVASPPVVISERTFAMGAVSKRMRLKA